MIFKDNKKRLPTGKGVLAILVGDFPPPVHGMATINAAIRNKVKENGIISISIDIGMPSINYSILRRIGKFAFVVKGLVKFIKGILTINLKKNRKNVCEMILYISISGGTGKLYEMVYIVLARIMELKIIMHHHSYSYLYKRKFSALFLFYLAGRKALHIVLSKDMEKELKKLYSTEKTLIVSNAVFLSSNCLREQNRQQLKTIGFLSNISKEKGIFEFIELFVSLIEAGKHIFGKIAGPFHDPRLKKYICKKLNYIPGIEYIGPKYDSEKEKFYEEIDVLVFPTHYVNEAEPLTIYEAMRSGIPVIAYGRGCIREMIKPGFGRVINPDEPFIPAALEQITEWISNPELFMKASTQSRKRFKKVFSENLYYQNRLLKEICN